jgi:hypothetical protein
MPFRPTSLRTKARIPAKHPRRCQGSKHREPRGYKTRQPFDIMAYQTILALWASPPGRKLSRNPSGGCTPRQL